MNFATVNRVLGINLMQKPQLAQLQGLAQDARQTPHIRNSAKELIRGRRYAPTFTYQNPLG